MKVFVIGDQTTCLAFSLGGIMTRVVKGREKTVEALQFSVENPGIGLVLITEKLAGLVRPEVDRILYSVQRPLVVEIPDTSGPLSDRRSAGELMMSLMKQ